MFLLPPAFRGKETSRKKKWEGSAIGHAAFWAIGPSHVNAYPRGLDVGTCCRMFRLVSQLRVVSTTTTDGVYAQARAFS